MNFDFASALYEVAYVAVKYGPALIIPVGVAAIATREVGAVRRAANRRAAQQPNVPQSPAGGPS